jgi:SAM-dependent methyltransferase
MPVEITIRDIKVLEQIITFFTIHFRITPLLIAYIAVLLAALILGISVSWTGKKGGPWVPTPMKTVHSMLKMAKVGPEDLVYDLGCGDGRLVTTAARHYGARAVGVEIDIIRVIWCRFLVLILGLRGKVKIIRGDFFRQEFSDADVITCYLLPKTMLELEDKLKAELKPGSRIVSNTFIFSKIELADSDDSTRLYIV